MKSGEEDVLEFVSILSLRNLYNVEDEEKFQLQRACGRIRAHKFKFMEMFEKGGCESSEFLQNLTTEYIRRNIACFEGELDVGRLAAWVDLFQYREVDQLQVLARTAGCQYQPVVSISQA